MMDKATRNEVRKMVAAARKVLEEDVRRQLEGVYAISADGRAEPVENVATLRRDLLLARRRREIEAAVAHEQARGASSQEAVDRFVRETAFTWLNRLAALRMMEARGLIRESVGRGADSSGFKLFQRACEEVCRALPDGGYRRYLELLCDDAAVELRPLFDRSLPHSHIFPGPAALNEVLSLLNGDKPGLDRNKLAVIWDEDETPGWIYQYFTPKEQREQARKESPAPRNAEEMAFRNQFYTPDYVVRFLVDNTLGRLWYEMHPHTRLVEACAYLVRRPGERVRQRERKDPRRIRVLDPACGSGHFLLYAFDVLAAIYEEAYPDPQGGEELRRDFPTEDEFRRAVPGLIVEHNLYGIDIDQRAVQIAALALWLKAKKHSPEVRVRRVNAVCAEPMPGEKELLREFLAELASPTLRRIAETVWEELRLADEVGSLLRAERAVGRVVQEERERWARRPRALQMALVPGQPRLEQAALDFSDVRDEGFWQEAEGRIVALLKEYAGRAGNGGAAARRLFAHDGEQGFQFLDALSQKYDVVLMNPPFGDPTPRAKRYLEQEYPRTKNDVYAAFVERGLELLEPGGYLGAITSRTGFFLSSFQRWREEVILKGAELTVFADLGFGVLDTAMVETAAYCLRSVGTRAG